MSMWIWLEIKWALTHLIIIITIALDEWARARARTKNSFCVHVIVRIVFIFMYVFQLKCLFAKCVIAFGQIGHFVNNSIVFELVFYLKKGHAIKIDKEKRFYFSFNSIDLWVTVESAWQVILSQRWIERTFAGNYL